MQFGLDKALLDYLIATDDLQKEVVLAHPSYIELFHDIDTHWRQEVLQGELDLDPFAAMLLGQSFFLWLATVRAALSCHGTAVFPILRTSLESACYGYKLANEPTARECWLHRDRSPEDLKVFRRSFTQCVSDVAKSIHLDHEWIAIGITSMYDGAIMFGGHPNPRFLLEHVTVDRGSNKRVPITLTCLNAADSWNTVRALVATAEAGLLISTVSALAFKEHPRADSVIAGSHALQARMEEIFAPLQSLAN